jgi:uncharacterized membrane protein
MSAFDELEERLNENSLNGIKAALRYLIEKDRDAEIQERTKIERFAGCRFQNGNSLVEIRDKITRQIKKKYAPILKGLK